jgi:Glycosyl hydrolase family 26
MIHSDANGRSPPRTWRAARMLALLSLGLWGTLYSPLAAAGLTTQENAAVTNAINTMLLAPASTTALLTYLQSLQASANSSPGVTINILTGHHADHYPSGTYTMAASYGQFNPTTGATAANVTIPEYLLHEDNGGTSTGQIVSILHVTPGLNTPGAPSSSCDAFSSVFGAYGSPEDGLDLANDWISAGGIVHISTWWTNPALSCDLTINIDTLLTSGSTLQNQFLSWVDSLAAILKNIQGTVIYRPLVEENGGWYWWGVQNGSASGMSGANLAALWQLIYNRLKGTDGVTNILFDYNVSDNSGHYSDGYPGSAYVDVVSFDSYSNTPGTIAAGSGGSYSYLLSLGKPLLISEAGVYSSDNTMVSPGAWNNDTYYLTDVEANTPQVIAIEYFTQNWALSQQQGAEAVMTDPNIINRTSLPAGVSALP